MADILKSNHGLRTTIMSTTHGEQTTQSIEFIPHDITPPERKNSKLKEWLGHLIHSYKKELTSKGEADYKRAKKRISRLEDIYLVTNEKVLKIKNNFNEWLAETEKAHSLKKGSLQGMMFTTAKEEEVKNYRNKRKEKSLKPHETLQCIEMISEQERQNKRFGRIERFKKLFYLTHTFHKKDKFSKLKDEVIQKKEAAMALLDGAESLRELAYISLTNERVNTAEMIKTAKKDKKHAIVAFWGITACITPYAFGFTGALISGGMIVASYAWGIDSLDSVLEDSKTYRLVKELLRPIPQFVKKNYLTRKTRDTFKNTYNKIMRPALEKSKQVLVEQTTKYLNLYPIQVPPINPNKSTEFSRIKPKSSIAQFAIYAEENTSDQSNPDGTESSYKKSTFEPFVLNISNNIQFVFKEHVNEPPPVHSKTFSSTPSVENIKMGALFPKI